MARTGDRLTVNAQLVVTRSITAVGRSAARTAVARGMGLIALSACVSIGLSAHAQNSSSTVSLRASSIAFDERLEMERAVRAATDRGRALLEPVGNGETHGTVELFESPGVLVLRVEITGLKPGMHGFHVLERRDCEIAAAPQPDEHLNPARGQHGEPAAAADGGHLGDLGNIRADDHGVARHWLRIDGLALHGEKGVVGHALVVRAARDDLESSPDGGAGRAEACGIIHAS